MTIDRVKLRKPMFVFISTYFETYRHLALYREFSTGSVKENGTQLSRWYSRADPSYHYLRFLIQIHEWYRVSIRSSKGFSYMTWCADSKSFCVASIAILSFRMVWMIMLNSLIRIKADPTTDFSAESSPKNSFVTTNKCWSCIIQVRKC